MACKTLITCQCLQCGLETVYMDCFGVCVCFLTMVTFSCYLTSHLRSYLKQFKWRIVQILDLVTFLLGVLLSFPASSHLAGIKLQILFPLWYAAPQVSPQFLWISGAVFARSCGISQPRIAQQLAMDLGRFPEDSCPLLLTAFQYLPPPTYYLAMLAVPPHTHEASKTMAFSWPRCPVGEHSWVESHTHTQISPSSRQDLPFRFCLLLVTLQSLRMFVYLFALLSDFIIVIVSCSTIT